jgi:sarcosine oxidase delta subunit
MTDQFERFLKYSEGRRGNVRAALIEVADTADGCRRWFASQKIPATAADIIAMARLVMERAAILDVAERQYDKDED